MTNFSQVVQQARAELGELLRDNPELLVDDELKADMIEGSTSVVEIMQRLLEEHAEACQAADGCANRILELRERKARFDKKAHLLEGMLHSLMNSAGLQKYTLPEATLTIRKGLPHVVITDENELPQGYYRQEIIPDKIAIKKSIQAGEAIPGATLAEGSPSLSIRRT